MAFKWQRVASFGRRRSASQDDASPDSSASCSSPVAEKGHFIVYSSEGTRFMVPLEYLRSKIFIELFAMAEDVFGLPGDGPIALPCDASVMDFVLSLLRKRAKNDEQKALLCSILKQQKIKTRSSFLVGQKYQQAVCSI